MLTGSILTCQPLASYFHQALHQRLTCQHATLLIGTGTNYSWDWWISLSLTLLLFLTQLHQPASNVPLPSCHPGHLTFLHPHAHLSCTVVCLRVRALTHQTNVKNKRQQQVPPAVSPHTGNVRENSCSWTYCKDNFQLLTPKNKLCNNFAMQNICRWYILYISYSVR